MSCNRLVRLKLTIAVAVEMTERNIETSAIANVQVTYTSPGDLTLEMSGAARRPLDGLVRPPTHGSRNDLARTPACDSGERWLVRELQIRVRSR